MGNFKELKWNKKAKLFIQNNFAFRLLMELLFSFILIFLLNLVVSLGQENIAFFYQIYNINILFGVYVGAITMAAFLLFHYFNISINPISNVVDLKNGIINKTQTLIIFLIQFIAVLFSSFFVYLIIVHISGDATGNNLGGFNPKIRGLFTSSSGIEISWAYGYAAIAGTFNFLYICIVFSFNAFLNKKYNHHYISQFYRYVFLILTISIFCIFSAHITNGNRILTSAIVIEVMGTFQEYEYDELLASIIFIFFQTFGLFFIYYWDNITKIIGKE